MRLILDAGALVAIDRRDHLVRARLRVAEQEDVDRVTSAAVVAQVWRNGARQANLARILAGVRTVGLQPDDGRRLGALLAASRTSDVVDAHLASLVSAGDQVLTSDPEDITHLLDTRRVRAEVRAV